MQDSTRTHVLGKVGGVKKEKHNKHTSSKPCGSPTFAWAAGAPCVRRMRRDARGDDVRGRLLASSSSSASSVVVVVPPVEPRPPLQRDSATRAQHLGDVQNMSGSAPSLSEPLDSCRETPAQRQTVIKL